MENKIITTSAEEWWEDMMDKDMCVEMEKKYGIYGHDEGVNSDDILRMYMSEFDVKTPNLISMKSIEVPKPEKAKKQLMIKTKKRKAKEKQIWVGDGKIMYLRNKAKEWESLENCVYKIQVDDSGTYFLKKVSDNFNFDYKIYGLETRLIDRVKKTYAHTSGNIGVLLNGLKGTGKTVSAKLISNALTQPVIIIGENFGNSAHSWLNSIPQNITLFIDEYEKIYDDDSSLLTIMDGAENSEYRRVFLMTTNRLNVNENMLDRPTRVLYLQSFGNLSTKVVFEILNDCVIHKALIEETAMFISSLSIITVDIVKAICREVNIHEESPFKFADIFNVKQLSGKYDIDMVFGNETELLKREVKISPRKEYWGEGEDDDNLVNSGFYIDDNYIGQVIERVDSDVIKVACRVGNNYGMSKILGKRAEAYGFLPKVVKKKKKGDEDEDDAPDEIKEMTFKISNSFMINALYKKGMADIDMSLW